MAPIQQLDATVVSKIAAGEVIERPASVVKELLENSIDAGSTRIDIELDQGGTERIQVVDDGCGIAAEQLPLAFTTHATSKLRDADDLFRIGTLGFRGEALASIGGVAQVTLQSRPRDQEHGAELQNHGGVLSPVKPWNGAHGTRIEVKHLFFNVPVRKKFLRAVATELGHVSETVTRIALAYPDLHLTLRHNGKLVYEVPATAGLTERIGLFFGSEVKEQLFDLEGDQGDVHLWGYIADPKCDRGTAKLQYLFLNGRWIRDRSLLHAIQEAYRGLLMSGRYAVSFLFLDLPPDQVDVNVHPTKCEVRFRDGQTLYHLVRSTVRQRLSAANLVPALQVPSDAESDPSLPRTSPTSTAPPRKEEAAATVAPWEVIEPTNPPSHSVSTPSVHQEPSRDSPVYPPNNPNPSPIRPDPSPIGPVPSPTDPHAPLAEPTPEPVKVVSSPLQVGARSLKAMQVHNAYLVAETNEGVLLIDQHALHERILFEQLRKRMQTGQLEVQRLLIPEPIDLSMEQAGTVLEAQDALGELGLDIQDFGGGTILLTGYPAILGKRSPTTILKGVIDFLLSKDRPPNRAQLLNHLLATMACKAAVKAGDRLTEEEIAALMAQRELAEDSHHCPHGRPTSLLFSRQELDKQFRRV